MKATPVADVSPILPKTIAWTLTAVPQSPGIELIRRYTLARSDCHEPNTAPTAPHSWSCTSCGKIGLPHSFETRDFILADERAEIVRLKLGVERVAAVFLGDVRALLRTHAMFEAEDDIGVHLDEAAIAVPGEARVARHGSQALDRRIVEAEVEDGVHHSRHRHARARCGR